MLEDGKRKPEQSRDLDSIAWRHCQVAPPVSFDEKVESETPYRWVGFLLAYLLTDL